MPQLPFDFITAVGISWFPPIWYSLMNPLVDSVLEGKTVEKSHYDKIKIIVSVIHIAIVAPFAFMAGSYLLH